MTEEENFLDPNSPASRAIRNRVAAELTEVIDAAMAREPETHPITLLMAMVIALANCINRLVPSDQANLLRAEVENMLRDALAYAKAHDVKPSADPPDRKH
jgi:hypothetical protein